MRVKCRCPHFLQCMCSDFSNHTSDVFPEQEGEKRAKLLGLELRSGGVRPKPEVFVTALMVVPRD